MNLNDEKSVKVAEAIANKTCKKILSILADKELSETEIAAIIKIPINTVDYNIKKLLEAGLIEKSKSFFWSVKGRKIETYRLSNKKIIISTKTSFGGLISSIVIFGSLGLAANVFRNIFSYSKTMTSSINLVSDMGVEKISSGSLARVPEVVQESAGLIAYNNIFNFSSLFNNAWIWIVLGIVFGVFAYFIFNKLKGGLNKI